VKDFYWIEEALGYNHIFFKIHEYRIQEFTEEYEEADDQVQDAVTV